MILKKSIPLWIVILFFLFSISSVALTFHSLDAFQVELGNLTAENANIVNSFQEPPTIAEIPKKYNVLVNDFKNLNCIIVNAPFGGIHAEGNCVWVTYKEFRRVVYNSKFVFLGYSENDPTVARLLTQIHNIIVACTLSLQP